MVPVRIKKVYYQILFSELLTAPCVKYIFVAAIYVLI